MKRPLPLSIVTESCAFRPVILALLQDQGIAWRTLFENGGIEGTRATVEADLAVTAWLVPTVPAGLVVLDADCGLPPLPGFAINLHLPPHKPPAAVEEFARHIRRLH